ncbi:MAG: PQQ-binding-like beta-propeller repeat protein, partial [Magnetospirillum sp.]|nr:PQQ-binding-like beta-propeller repeat protein [Magnetospirillum sp.]
ADTLYFPNNRHVYALNLDTGELKWRAPAAAPSSSIAVVPWIRRYQWIRFSSPRGKARPIQAASGQPP